MISNLLAAGLNVFEGFGEAFSLNWIGNIIKWLIEGVGNIGVGIILFTLILKVITLPFDVYSKVATKKNSVKMERMRPELEKLQRQYANNKELYNKKVQAIYKKQGYSMLSSCLPMLVTIIIFIVVIGEFSNYSNYSNLKMINEMSFSYNAAIEKIAVEDETLVKVEGENSSCYYIVTEEFFTNEKFADYSSVISNAVEYKSGSGYNASFKMKEGAFSELGRAVKELNEKGFSAVKVGKEGEDCHIVYDEATGAYSINKSKYGGEVTDEQITEDISNKLVDYLGKEYLEKSVKPVAAQAAAEKYESNRPSFLWIKNLWVQDLPWKHPVQTNLSDYEFYKKLDLSQEALKQEYFTDITAELSKEKAQANGYLILVVLSIGVMLVSQFIMQKMQQPQLELQSVDKDAAASSKMMLWMMPVMYGVFAFMYTASFSLYMIVSSVVSTLSTLIINVFVEKSFKKKLEEESRAMDKRIRK